MGATEFLKILQFLKVRSWIHSCIFQNMWHTYLDNSVAWELEKEFGGTFLYMEEERTI